MFCSNCGSLLVEGAKFCSECGTKVEEVKVRDFGAIEIDESANITDKLEGEAMGANEAFESRVSFDWSNVIDEPQKKEIPEGIKSPWAATTDSIDEREIYTEMTQTDDKNRTMSFIDVLKADKEERERAARDASIDYTEVLEIDPELIGDAEPPKMHIPPLYEDVDEPVKTPFDDKTADWSDELSKSESEEASEDNAELELKPSLEDETADMPAEVENESSKFELPGFLKRAVGLAADNGEKTEPDTEGSEESFLDEDIYLDLEERASDTGRMSRVYAHTLAGDYDWFDDTDEDPADDTDEETIDNTPIEINDEVPAESTDTAESTDADAADADADIEDVIDENELFSEMTAADTGKTGMTIAAPADEEAEIEALKKRLAELTGTVEIDPELLENAQADADNADDIEVKTEPQEVQEVFEEKTEEPVSEVVKEAEEGSFEALGSEFAFDDKIEEPTFVPEITPADDAFFAGLSPASKVQADTDEDAGASFGLKYEDDFFADNPIADESAETKELTAVEKSFGLVADEQPLEDKVAIENIDSIFEVAGNNEEESAHIVTEEKTAEIEEEPAPTVEELLAKYVPQYFGPNAGNDETEKESEEEKEAVITGLAAESITESAPAESIAISENAPEEPLFESFLPDFTPDEDSPIVGFAPAITETADAEVQDASGAAEPAVISLDDFLTDKVEQTEPVKTEVATEPKVTDAVSLDELENDLFGLTADDDAEAETTKKIDKFYTLYRKNEEFQRLLDEEYSRIKGENIVVPEEEVPEINVGASAKGASPEEEGADDEVIPIVSNDLSSKPDDETVLKEIAGERPVEDATIYRVGMPDDGEVTANDSKGFSVEGTSTEAVKEEATSDAASNDLAAEYENVDSGSTILTVLAVIVAVLLVLLLAIILILHIAPSSEIAMTINDIIENITGRFSAINAFEEYRLM